MQRVFHFSGNILAFFMVLCFLCAPDVHAVPSYARQTGLACAQCHRAFPQLTSFGREFKAGGYTLSQLKSITAKGGTTAPLKLNEVLPLSLMFQAAYERTDEKQPGTQNDDVYFPQQFSVFLAGEMTPHVGTFLQVTYTQEDDKFSMDNTDIRIAYTTALMGKQFAYGLTLNNNPTVEDLWNSTPAWGFPFASPDDVPAPAAAALVDGGLGQEAAGLGAYGFYNRQWYGDVTLYRTAQIGGPEPPSADSEDTINDVAPYWRFAWQMHDAPYLLELGTYGLYAKLYPQGVSGETDNYTDLGFDWEFSRQIGDDEIVFQGTYIYETVDLDASFAAGNASHTSNDLHTARANASYYLDGSYVFTLAGFLIRGDKDNHFYSNSDDPLQTSAGGSPDSDGIIGQAAYYPWQNLRLSLQYTYYTQFNGSKDNYNGQGRDATDNNTLYVLAWFMW